VAINLSETIGRILPGGLAMRATPLLRMADNVLSGTDSASVSQRTALIAFFIRVASAVIAFVSQVLLARWLGGFEYGIFVAVWVAVIILATLTGVGFPSAVIRFVAEYREKRQEALLRGVIVFSLVIAFIASTVIAAAGAFILYNFPGLVTQYFVIPVYLAAICLPMIALPGVIDGVARAFNWPTIAFVPTFILRPIGILLVMGLALMAGWPASAETAMWSLIIACYGTTLGQFAALYRKLNRTLPKGKAAFSARYWVMTALPMFLVEGFYFLQTSVDVLFVSAMMQPEDTAVYYASTKVLALVHFVYFAVRAAVSHRYTALYTSGNIGQLREFAAKTAAWTFWPSLLLAVMMVIFGKYFLLLFGAEFVAGESLIWILVIGIVMRASIGPAEALLMMSGRQKICALTCVVTLFINMALNLALIPVWGLHGAAIATTCALAFESLALYAAVRRKLGIHVFVLPLRTAPTSIGAG